MHRHRSSPHQLPAPRWLPVLPTRRLRIRRLETTKGPGTAWVVRLHPDAATDVTFVHTETPTMDATSDGCHFEPVLEAVLADEVLHELAATTS